MEYYPDIQGKELLIYATTWMDLKLSWVKKANPQSDVLHFIYIAFSKQKNYRDGEQSGAFQESEI